MHTEFPATSDIAGATVFQEGGRLKIDFGITCTVAIIDGGDG